MILHQVFYQTQNLVVVSFSLQIELVVELASSQLLQLLAKNNYINPLTCIAPQCALLRYFTLPNVRRRVDWILPVKQVKTLVNLHHNLNQFKVDDRGGKNRRAREHCSQEMLNSFRKFV
jgi:hypothetical protein